MKLEAKRYTADEWNNEIMPLVEKGELTEEPPAGGFLLIYQKFHGVVKDKTGKRFSCVGWHTPNGKKYVQVDELENVKLTKNWYLYILVSVPTERTYIGISPTPWKRILTHNLGKGAKATRSKKLLPWRLALIEFVGTHGDALKREHMLKKLSHKERMQLVESHDQSTAAI